MTYCKLFVITFLATGILSINYALNMEEIIGGNLAYPANHKYQVAIFGKHNRTQSRNLMCTGGIISDFFILSSANCVIAPNGQLRRLRFYVIVGLITLTIDDNLTKEISYIYTYGHSLFTYRNMITVLELANSLNLHNSTTLESLQLPTRYDIYEGRQGTVAGYGFTSVDSKTGIEARIKNQITEISKQNLTYAFVDIAMSNDCLVWYPYMHPSKEMCGTIKPNMYYSHRGLCTYDGGAPVVIENTVIGIANKNRKDCNDTVEGNLYSNVSFFLNFIHGILKGNYLQNTEKYANRPIN